MDDKPEHRPIDIDACASQVLSRPHDPESYMALGRVLMERNMPQEAIAAFEAAYALHRSSAWFDLASAYEQTQEYAKAFDIWLQRLEFLLRLQEQSGDNAQTPLAIRTKFRWKLKKLLVSISRHNAGSIQAALADCKLAVYCWNMAYRLPVSESRIDIGA
jgi:tetratricopeptide (TPR) repeat protein